ncbi:MAG: DUF1269 domain-containing protein [Myxococcaceae bacterium]
MKTRIWGALVLVSSSLAFGAVEGVAVYPSKGQSAQKQAKDDQACKDWSTQQTGVDPQAVAAPNKTQSNAGSSAARGGLIGAGVGIITGNPLAGAAVGAGTGAAVGHNRRRTQQSDSVKQQLASFDASYSACMSGKGYTTKATQ